MPATSFKLRCRLCNQPVLWPPPGPRCPRPACKGPLQPARTTVFDPTLIEPGQPGMWRYLYMLPPLPPQPVTMGEGWTPLLEAPRRPYRLFYKNESLNPTGSYKDRGAALLINVVGEAKVVIDDSSGNAGAALAAYAARAGLQARIFAPKRAPAAKRQQIMRYGADLVLVDGNRDQVTAVATAAAESPDVFYASHIWHPGYALANQAIAWEIWEQLGGRVPDWVILPVGNGSLLRGLRWGFRALQKGKQTKTLPRLVAVQAANCAPLVALSQGTYTKDAYVGRRTIADGVAIANPPLIDAMWSAVRKTDGVVLGISEEQIRSARAELLRQGFFVEPTAALPYAALAQLADRLQPDHTVVLILTGHGFKSS